eukprot:5090372-Pleurochrysis_carterae.AAC.1
MRAGTGRGAHSARSCRAGRLARSVFWQTVHSQDSQKLGADSKLVLGVCRYKLASRAVAKIGGFVPELVGALISAT